MRPLVAAACWLIAKKVADDTPPNVLPPVRVAMSVLSSVSAAATEVSCLGTVGRSGTHALVGWGFGAGAGLVSNAAWPFVLTHKAGRVLRSATGGVYYLRCCSFVAGALCGCASKARKVGRRAPAAEGSRRRRGEEFVPRGGSAQEEVL